MRAQRAYVARQQEARVPPIGAIYKALATALYTANRTNWWKHASPDVRRAVLEIVSDSVDRLRTSGFSEKAIRSRFNSVFSLPDSPEIDLGVPSDREQVLLDQIRADRKAA